MIPACASAATLGSWIAVGALSLVLIVFVVYLGLRRGGTSEPAPVPEANTCCCCLREEAEDFYCATCYRRSAARFEPP